MVDASIFARIWLIAKPSKVLGSADREMSAWGHTRTFQDTFLMSALRLRADILSAEINVR